MALKYELGDVVLIPFEVSRIDISGTRELFYVKPQYEYFHCVAGCGSWIDSRDITPGDPWPVKEEERNG